MSVAAAVCTNGARVAAQRLTASAPQEPATEAGEVDTRAARVTRTVETPRAGRHTC